MLPELCKLIEHIAHSGYLHRYFYKEKSYKQHRIGMEIKKESGIKTGVWTHWWSNEDEILLQSRKINKMVLV